MRTVPLYVVLVTMLACGRAAQTDAAPRDYLFVWTASTDSTQPDFLAVLDATEDSAGHGRLVTTMPVPGRENVPHHTEHELASDGKLFANGFATGQSFVFDLTDPLKPTIVKQFGEVEGYAHPHSYVRLPNGHVLATFQMRHGTGGTRPGGLVELTTSGEVVRSVSAEGPGVDSALRVYSAAVVSSLDRVVTTTTDMNKDAEASRMLQLWRLSDLTLLKTFPLPDGPAGGEGLLTAEPRLLADGKAVLVSTFSCGLYLLRGLDTDAPSGSLVASFPRKDGTNCAIPVIAGHYYLATVPAWNAVVVLDIADPEHPREVSRVSLGAGDVPHWISLSPDTRRVVITGYADLLHRILVARFDTASGRIELDETFRDAGATVPGVRMDNKQWPHGGAAAAVPHGAVFSRRPAPAVQ